jgi:hypothetical protein
VEWLVHTVVARGVHLRTVGGSGGVSPETRS